MAKVTWKQLYDAESDYFDSIEEAQGMAEEAEGCKSWEALGIEYGEDGLSVPEGFDTEQALSIIHCYLDIIDGDKKLAKRYGEDVYLKATQYEEYTRPHRGADDGTYDYAGTYVGIILGALAKTSL